MPDLALAPKTRSSTYSATLARRDHNPRVGGSIPSSGMAGYKAKCAAPETAFCVRGHEASVLIGVQLEAAGRSDDRAVVADRRRPSWTAALHEKQRREILAQMLSSARVAPTLAVNDLERARRFYEEKLGFEVEVQVAETVRYRCGHGTGLAIFERPMTPVDRTVAAFEVQDIEAEVDDLRANGVEVEGVITLDSGVRRAFFKDPDGNIIGMRQI